MAIDDHIQKLNQTKHAFTNIQMTLERICHFIYEKYIAIFASNRTEL